MRSKFLLLLPLLTLAACDRPSRALDAERADQIYRAAMADYTAGRLAEAVKGLERVVRATPGNASARFQLACLYQDFRHDNLSALCQYREYLLLEPKSEKASVAAERAERCERALAPELSRKYQLGNVASLSEDVVRLEREIAEAKADRDQALQQKAKLEERVRKLEEEAVRLRRMVGSLETDIVSRERPKEVTDKSILEDDESTVPVVGADEVRRLLAEEAEETESGVTPFKKVERVEKAEEVEKGVERPKTYVVQEGDTLYEIARRFYGRISAWKQIRDANKAVISTDGRINAGQKLVLP